MYVCLLCLLCIYVSMYLYIYVSVYLGVGENSFMIGMIGPLALRPCALLRGPALSMPLDHALKILSALKM